ncbi:MAG: hypothetical protein U0234_09570 [Sandaracinus sp.]
MTPRSLARCAALPLLLLACDCGGTSDGLPAALARYPRDVYSVTPTDETSVPGLRFYRVTTIGELDHSSTSLVALDEHDTLLEGSDLFVRFSGMPPDELARRACVTLTDGCTPLAEGDPSGAMWVGGEASRIHAPRIEEGHLVFDAVVGDMAPSVVHMTVDVASGTILSRETLSREPSESPATETGVRPIHATVAIGADRFVTATLEGRAVIGCVSSVVGTCFATLRVPLDGAAEAELAQLLADVRAIQLCEPEAIVPGDLDYQLSWEGAPRAYAGHLPADESNIAARGSGPCRADARLAWWIARWILASSRAASEMPSPLSVTLDVTRDAGPSFVNATVHWTGARPTIEGCTAAVGGSCRATHQVELDEARAARLAALVEDVRSEPCHVPFPAGAPLSIPMSLAYDGRCGADAALAWWVAEALEPGAFAAAP